MSAVEQLVAAPQPLVGRALGLRDYQQEALDAALASPWRRQIVALPTGTGKTVIFASQIAGVVAAGGRALVLVHRDELAQQTVEKLSLVAPGLDVGMVKAERNECDAPVVIASVQTVCRPNRMHQLGRDFSLVVVDECHHAPAASYRAVLTYLGCFSPEPTGPLLMGYTATPERADRASLLDVFEGIVFHRDILTMVRAGYLCDVRGVQVRLDMDLDRVHSRGGDFVEGELASEMTRAHAPEHVVQAYQEHAAGRKALAFLPSVALAEETAGFFRAAGILAAHVSGRTPLAERRALVADLKAGRLRVVANCGVFTEGFDDPSIDCILLARPTHSHSLYVQMVGRVLRTSPGKECALVVDFVGASSRHTLQTLGRLFSRVRAHGGSVLEAEAAEEEAAAVAAAERAARSEAAQRAADTRQWRAGQESWVGELVGHRVDLFHRQPLHWVQGRGLYVLTVPGGCVALCPAPSGEGYRVVHVDNKRVVADLARQRLPLEYAQGVAEDWARQNDAEGLARWQERGDSREEPASEKQLNRWRWRGLVPPASLTRGRASELITIADALEALEHERRTRCV